MKPNHRYLKKGFAVFFLLAVWQISYLAVGNEIMLASPAQVLKMLIEQLPQEEFRRAVFSSMERIAKGFFLAFFLGFFLSVCAFRFVFFKIMLEPFISVLKSVPVASFVVLILMWTGSHTLSVWISFLVVLPGIYESTLSGFESADKKMLEAADIYEMSGYHRWFYIYRPSVLPYLRNASRVTAGMAWKSGVAAELIGTPKDSVGEKLYMSKIMFDTGEVLAWTIVIILLSSLFEKLLVGLLELCGRQRQSIVCIHGRKSEQAEFSWVEGKQISKKFGENIVFQDYDFLLENHKITALVGESGIGKTTFLNMLCGLIPTDSGSILTDTGKRLHFAYVFQEDRLCENADAVSNCAVFAGKSQGIREELEEILPKDSLGLPVCQLSGGMRRRVSIAAAMCSRADVILMDEPFNGLDWENKVKTALYIKKRQQNRMLIFTTHSSEEIKLLQADNIKQIT